MTTQDNNTELWKVIADFTNYEVSTHGRIRNVSKTPPHILNPSLTTFGYQKVILGGRALAVHRLVAKAFLVPPNNKDRNEINHKNAIKTDNGFSNLEWVTRKENMQHAERMNLVRHPKGEEVGTSKITREDVKEIRRLIEMGFTTRIIGSRFGIDHSQVSNIKLGKRWKHI